VLSIILAGSKLSFLPPERVERMDGLASIVGHLVWPGLVAFLVWVFKEPVRDVLTRGLSGKLPGGLEINIAPPDRLHETRRENDTELGHPLAPQNSYMWRKKVANTFWLGHDLMFTIDVILRGKPREEIVHGLCQSLHHLEEIGLSDSIYGSNLERLYESAVGSLESDWTAEKRISVTRDLLSLRNGLGALVKLEQPDYRPT
jgi:hypothetical protein